MSKRAILLILDGLGIGAMDDLAEQQRLQDRTANTLANVLTSNPDLELPNLNKLGLKAAASLTESKPLAAEINAAYSRARLSYDGADTFMGHQEIMGSSPTHPKIQPFKEVYHEVAAALIKAGYQVTVPDQNHPYLLVNEKIVVADNIEADYGQIYNVSASLDEINFDTVLAVGKTVRATVKVSRIIALAGKNTTTKQIIDSIESPNSQITGVNSTASGVYGEGYQVIHLGYGIDHRKQISSILAEQDCDVRLIGKVQDVIHCPQAREKLPAVATEQVLSLMLSRLEEVESGLIAVNVQETDLAGHQQDAAEYGRVLKLVDSKIPDILAQLKEDDLLIITADHGDDPTVGHSHHTREEVPLLVYQPGIKAQKFDPRASLADIAATIADYLTVKAPESGESFLAELQLS